MSSYDDGWLLDSLATEIKLNDPRSESLKQPPAITEIKDRDKRVEEMFHANREVLRRDQNHS